MAQVTADLEYFKCDLCSTYFHRDIFCDHRRLCNGPGSTELNKRQADAVSHALDVEESRSRSRTGGPGAPVDALSQRGDNRTRTKLAQDVYSEEQAALQKRLKSIDADALMAELDGL